MVWWSCVRGLIQLIRPSVLAPLRSDKENGLRTGQVTTFSLLGILGFHIFPQIKVDEVEDRRQEDDASLNYWDALLVLKATCIYSYSLATEMGDKHTDRFSVDSLLILKQTHSQTEQSRGWVWKWAFLRNRPNPKYGLYLGFSTGRAHKNTTHFAESNDHIKLLKAYTAVSR